MINGSQAENSSEKVFLGEEQPQSSPTASTREKMRRLTKFEEFRKSRKQNLTQANPDATAPSQNSAENQLSLHQQFS